MMKAGHPQEQAVAAAYRQQRESKRKKSETADALVAVADADGRLWTRDVILADDDTELEVLLEDGAVPTRDGYLKAMARVARVGAQTYRGHELGLPDREHVTLYRPPEEVFARDAMRSMANKPITLTHPKRMVDKSTWGKVAKGWSGNEVVRDGEFVRVPLMLADAAAIQAFEDGEARELSVGYTTDIDWTAGETPDGIPYAGVQRSIRANHHALVPVARGGENLRFGDAVEGQGAGLTTCKNCGAKLTGHPMSCPICGYDLKPTSHPGEKIDMGDFDPDQPRGDDGKWTSGSGGSGNGGAPHETLQERNRRRNASADINPEDYDDNDQNWPDVETRYGPDPNRPGKQRSYQLQRPKPNVKLAPGQEKFYRMDAAPYWMNDKEFSEGERETLAEKGHALPGGGYPIRNRKDLSNAIQAFGRAKNPAATKALIKRRAKELGAESMLPDDWKSSASDAASSGISGEEGVMPIIKNFDGIPISFADEVSAAAMEREFRNMQQRLADAGSDNFGGKKAKPFGKKNGNGNGDDDGDDDADSVEAKRKKVAAEDALKKDVAAKDGEIAVLKKQLADAALSDAKIEALAAERIAVLDAAKPFLPKDFKDSGKTLADIRRATVATSFTDAEMKDWTDDQVIGAFRTMVKVQPNKGGASTLADGLSAGMRANAGYLGPQTALSDGEKLAETEYQNYVRRLQDGYKKPFEVVRN